MDFGTVICVFYSTPSTEGVESTRVFCLFVFLYIITFSFFKYWIIWWSRPCQPYIVWKHITLATSTALFWPSITRYRPLLTKYNQLVLPHADLLNLTSYQGSTRAICHFLRELFWDTLYVYCLCSIFLAEYVFGGVLLGLSMPTFTILGCVIFDRWYIRSYSVLLCSIPKHQLRDPFLNTTHDKAPRSNMQYRSCHQRQYQLYAKNITTFFATHQHKEIWALYQKQVWWYFETKYSHIYQSWERVCFRSVWHYQKQ